MLVSVRSLVRDQVHRMVVFSHLQCHFMYPWFAFSEDHYQSMLNLEARGVKFPRDEVLIIYFAQVNRSIVCCNTIQSSPIQRIVHVHNGHAGHHCYRSFHGIMTDCRLLRNALLPRRYLILILIVCEGFMGSDQPSETLHTE